LPQSLKDVYEDDEPLQPTHWRHILGMPNAAAMSSLPKGSQNRRGRYGQEVLALQATLPCPAVSDGRLLPGGDFRWGHTPEMAESRGWGSKISWQQSFQLQYFTYMPRWLLPGNWHQEKHS